MAASRWPVWQACGPWDVLDSAYTALLTKRGGALLELQDATSADAIGIPYACFESFNER